MKAFNLLLLGLLLSGCTKTVVETQYVVKEVPVPVYKKLPKVRCNLKGSTSDEILNRYIECIAKQKRVLKLAE